MQAQSPIVIGSIVPLRVRHWSTSQFTFRLNMNLELGVKTIAIFVSLSGVRRVRKSCFLRAPQ